LQAPPLSPIEATAAAFSIQGVRMTMTIRSAGEADAPLLAEIGAATFVETFGHLYSNANLSRFLEDHHSAHVWQAILADEKCAAWLAFDRQGNSLAYALVGPCTLPVENLEANAGELSRLYVKRRAQGTGIGRALLDLALAKLEDDFEAVYLSVWSENVRAQQIYAARGFRKVAEYKYMVGDHADDEWIMRKF